MKTQKGLNVVCASGVTLSEALDAASTRGVERVLSTLGIGEGPNAMQMKNTRSIVDAISASGNGLPTEKAVSDRCLYQLVVGGTPTTSRSFSMSTLINRFGIYLKLTPYTGSFKTQWIFIGKQSLYNGTHFMYPLLVGSTLNSEHGAAIFQLVLACALSGNDETGTCTISVSKLEEIYSYGDQIWTAPSTRLIEAIYSV